METTNPLDDEQIPARMKRKREELGLSLEEVALQLKVLPELVQAIEEGLVAITIPLFMEFCVLYKSQMCDLLREPPVYLTEEAILDDYIDLKIGESYAAYRLNIDVLTLRRRASNYRSEDY